VARVLFIEGKERNGEKMNWPKLKHVILTRFNLGLYDREDADEWMKHRMPLFEKTRESVLKQEGDFTWILSLDKRTPNRYLQEIITDERMIVSHEHPNTFEPDGWTITTRLDNDDLYKPGAVEAIQRAFRPVEMVVDLKYHQLVNGEEWTSGGKADGWERPHPNSPFLSLISKEKNCYIRPHSKMINDFPAKFASKDVLAYMVIHDNNLGNQIVGRKA
jgi:hypothetical protein